MNKKEKVIDVIPCTFTKPFENGHFKSCLEGSLQELNKKNANCLTARYYKGIGAMGDNAIISVIVDEDE